jgi:3-oxoacyl-[acyl-carrier protein] reductase
MDPFSEQGKNVKLSDKIALITGAGRGIGKEIARKFSDEGAKVVLNDLEISPAEAICEKFKQMGREALAIQADVSKELEVQRMVEQANKEFGRIDILINNAGLRKDSAFLEMTESDWDSVMSVQLKGSFHCCRAVVPYMVKQRAGKIVNISSPVPAALGKRGQVNYSSASSGIEGFTRALALELGPYNVNVNCLAPDYIYTEMTRNAALRDGFYYADLQRFIVADIPLKRLGTPADVANVALFLVSEESSFISGQVLYVRGGP